MIKLFTFFRLLFRSIVRYKRNHYIMVAIGLAAFMVVLISGMMMGIKDQLFKLMYINYTGDLMVINREVKIGADPNPVQVGWDQLLVDEGQVAQIKKDANIQGVYQRLTLMASVMGEDDEKNQYATVIGCDFAQEENTAFRALLNFEERAAALADGVLVSAKIAEKLGLKIGDAVYLFFLTDLGMTPAKFPISGIFTGKGFPGVVNSLIYIDYPQLKAALLLEADQYSYFLVTLKDKKQAAQSLAALTQILPADWQTVLPEVAGKFILSQGVMYDFITGLSMGLMYLSIFLFIYSTLLISIKGRQREIGIMATMGVDRKNIFAIYSGEGVLLGFLPAFCGSVCGLGVVLLLSVLGIPAVNEAMKYGIASDVLYFKVDLHAVLYTIGGVSLIAFLGTIPPTLKILRLRPVEALRND